jgi:aspartate carbamoyltransferase catalytic subunit
MVHQNRRADNNHKELGLAPDPNIFLSNGYKISVSDLQRLKGSSICSINEFDASLLSNIYILAACMETERLFCPHALKGKIVLTTFLEASTRTRLSFESAAVRLGANVLSILDIDTTGAAKGETLHDIGQMINSYADAVVARIGDTNKFNQLYSALQLPLINAGNGTDEHPTQALADWYTILKWRPEIFYGHLAEKKKLNIGIIGNPSIMRTVKSFVMLLPHFSKNINSVTIFSKDKDIFCEKTRFLSTGNQLNVHVENKLNPAIQTLDILYMNSIVFKDNNYTLVGQDFFVDNTTKFKKGAVILHPLARRDELSPLLDTSMHNLYFNQAKGAVYIRAALFLALFDKVKNLPGEFLKE